MHTNKVLNNFRDFLVISWESFKLFDDNLDIYDIEEDTILEERANNWLQTNWEILVEQSLCGVNEFLDFYGDGADCNGGSSRVWLPDKLPTHRIRCKIKTESICIDIFTKEKINVSDITKMRFIKFTTLDENGVWFNDRKPFDCILLSPQLGIENILIRLEEIEFYIEKIY